MILDVTGTLSATVPLGTAESFQFTGVPNGTYTFSLRAQNGGGVSPSSNSVTLTFPSACSGAAGADEPAGHTVREHDLRVLGSAASGAAPTSYVLDVTGAFTGSFPTTGAGPQWQRSNGDVQLLGEGHEPMWERARYRGAIGHDSLTAEEGGRRKAEGKRQKDKAQGRAPNFGLCLVPFAFCSRGTIGSWLV